MADAIAWATSFDVPLTLYLYDEGTNWTSDTAKI